MRPRTRVPARKAVPCSVLVVLFATAGCSDVRQNESSGPEAPATTPRSTDGIPSTSSVTTSTANPTTSTSSSTTTSTIPDITTDWEAFDRVVVDEVIGGGAYDVSVAVVRGGEVIHTVTAAKRGESVDPSTPFRLASVSKTVTTIAALMLVEEGRLELDAPVLGDIAQRAGLPLADPRAASITLRQLLSNTSGIDSHLDYFFAPTDDDVSTMLARAMRQPLFDEPGGSYRYSNVNFQLVGLLLEQTTGESYESLVRRMILDPLGLTSFRFARDDANQPGEPVYSVSGGRRYMLMLGPGGAWTASASDIALLVDDLRWGRNALLGPDLVEEMFTPQTPRPADPRWDYGLGVRIFDSGAVGHTGTIESVRTIVITRPDGLTFAVLVNGWHPLETDELLDVLFAAELAARGLVD